jgi:hypothetical protein
VDVRLAAPPHLFQLARRADLASFLLGLVVPLRDLFLEVGECGF